MANRITDQVASLELTISENVRWFLNTKALQPFRLQGFDVYFPLLIQISNWNMNQNEGRKRYG
jgi:hypothetical protein